jgi:glycosyltransferase involved in cell wall biosynthesis
MTVLSHPTGNRNVRAVLASLIRHDLLTTFHGTVAQSTTARWPRMLPARLRSEFDRRRYDLPPAKLHSHPFHELARLFALRGGAANLVRHETGLFCVDRVYAKLDAAVARSLSHAVKAAYAYEDGALATFTRARALGLHRVYDLPIAYWEHLRVLLLEDGKRLPAWASTLGGGLTDSPAKLNRKTRELELAELVVTPSRFVADSLPAWAHEKRILISPFGSPPPLEPQVSAFKFQLSAQRAASGGKLRVLFAGSMGQRKGLGDLMAAVRQLARKDVELVVMGSLQADRAFYDRECSGFIYESGRSHANVLELMRSCDVFCLPSIVEGRALVMQEAMSQGLPLIITPNTGGSDLVEPISASHNFSISSPPPAPAAPSLQVSGLKSQVSSASYGRSATGFLVPIRSPESIAQAISWYADHRAETLEMGKAAQAKAAEYTWEAYGDRVVAAIQDLLAKPPK